MRHGCFLSMNHDTAEASKRSASAVEFKAAPGTHAAASDLPFNLGSGFRSCLERDLRIRIAQVAPLTERVPPLLYDGTERIVCYLTEELVALGFEGSCLQAATPSPLPGLSHLARRPCA